MSVERTTTRDFQRETKHTPVYTLFKAPREYLHTLTTPLRAELGELSPDDPNHTLLQERRWKESTGVLPEDSHFTLILPIHDEEVMLRDSLASLMGSDIPGKVPMQVVMVTNACSDNSVSQVKQFMEALGEVQERKLKVNQSVRLVDPGLDQQARTVQLRETTFIHLNTSTPGKANALTIGNTLAMERGDSIAINVDTNNFLERDALRNMYGRAYKSIVSKPDGTALLSGIHKHVSKKTRFIIVKDFIKTGLKNRPPEKKKLGRTQGCFMAWDTNFVDAIGGIPPVAIEDYALGMKALVNQRKTKRVRDANVWGYSSARLRDTFAVESRFVMGKLQTANLGPDEEKAVREFDKASPFKSLRERITKVNEIPASVPFRLGKFILLEAARINGRRMYKKDPDNQSWQPIKSTKGNI